MGDDFDATTDFELMSSGDAAMIMFTVPSESIGQYCRWGCRCRLIDEREGGERFDIRQDDK